MSRPTPEELEALRESGRSADLRRAFANGERSVAEWERGQPATGLAEVLDWTDQLRRVFGDPEVDRDPWIGDDFRL